MHKTHKKQDDICPECEGKKLIDGAKCWLCYGSGIYIETDSYEKFMGEIDFSG